ncbi:MAG: penicillin-binding protein 2 [Acidimicrobiales bacterium]
MFWKKKNKKSVDFEEILLDASNLPSFNRGRMEGKMELPITRYNVGVVAAIFILIALWFLTKIFTLQIVEGDTFRSISENNSIDKTVIVAERGVVYDRNGELLAWNEPDKDDVYTFPVRAYTDRLGLGQLIGYVSYPLKDKKGFYYRTEYIGRNGVESSYNEQLSGVNGQQLIETDALGEVIGEHIVDAPVAGKELTLSLDVRLSEAMHDIIATSTLQSGSRSGAAVIMDVHTGEIIAMSSYPSYDPEVMADGDDVDLIVKYNTDDRFPFLNKVLAGVYTPGSIMKPFLAYGALEEKVISPNKIIVSTGEIVIPNPWNPSNPAIFTDWRAHGKMDMREAIAYSSNVYFYYISGGYGDQEGMGIVKMNEYYDLFGFGKKTGVVLANEQTGTVPSPEWKEEVFDEPWRLGNTYQTAIGQFGWQVTPLQIVVAYGALANGGRFFKPHILKDQEPEFVEKLLDEESLEVVREGMHMTTYYPGGTARSLEKPYVKVAAKSGTAELDSAKARLNTWAAGYWPYEDPQYSFVVLMENAPYSNSLGGTRLMGDIMDWMYENTPEYLGIEVSTEEHE